MIEAQNSMKNKNGMDTFDMEAMRCGEAKRTLDSFRPKVTRKKVKKVNVNHFLREKTLI